MSFLKASSSFTRFRIIDDIPQETWESIPAKLRQFSFTDIDDMAEERCGAVAGAVQRAFPGMGKAVSAGGAGPHAGLSHPPDECRHRQGLARRFSRAVAVAAPARAARRYEGGRLHDLPRQSMAGQKGLPRFSPPTLVSGPCPGQTRVSSGSVYIRLRMDAMSCAALPPGRSDRPTER